MIPFEQHSSRTFAVIDVMSQKMVFNRGHVVERPEEDRFVTLVTVGEWTKKMSRTQRVDCSLGS